MRFDDIDKAVKYHGAKSKEVSELLYELVDYSDTAVSHKSKKRQWKLTVTEEKCFITYIRLIKKSGIQE